MLSAFVSIEIYPTCNPLNKKLANTRKPEEADYYRKLIRKPKETRYK